MKADKLAIGAFWVFSMAIDIGVIGVHVAEYLKPEPAMAATMITQWEYHTIMPHEHPEAWQDRVVFEKWLNQQGRDGWELCDSYRLQEIVMKRKVAR